MDNHTGDVTFHRMRTCDEFILLGLGRPRLQAKQYFNFFINAVSMTEG
jgi:hypothetical protein